MDTSYMLGAINADMDFNGMFDQYMHKTQYGRYDHLAPHRGGMNPPQDPPSDPVPHSHPHPHQQLYPHQGHPGGVELAATNPHFPPQQLYIPPIAGQPTPIPSTGYMPHHQGMLSPSNPTYTTTTHAMMGRGGPPATMPPNMAGVMGAYYHPAPVASNESPASGGSPSPGSEDSNDDISALRQNKRPSPDTGDMSPVGAAVGPGAGRGKKPKISKKSKKKKDPNEPHKPVSAYALFFRDAQANIRVQNPNAVFGEVSKTVASLWDSMDADSKNVYKKKTEVAKKEYLKLLAAYRASLVSKGGEGDTKYPSSGQGFPPHYTPTYGAGYPGGINSQMPQQQQQQQPPPASHPHPAAVPPQQLSPHSTPSGHMNPIMDGSPMVGGHAAAPPMSQPMPPTGLMSQQQQQQQQQQSVPMGSQIAPPTNSGYLSQQVSPGLGSPPPGLASTSTSPAPPHQLHLSTPHSPHLYTQQAQHSPPQTQQQQHHQAQHHHYPQQQTLPSPDHPHHSPHQPVSSAAAVTTYHQQQQQQQHHHQQNSPPNTTSPPHSCTPPNTTSPNTTTTPNTNNSSSTSTNNSGPSINTTMSVTATDCRTGHCIRSGCSNPAVQSSEWENEYCSNECVVNHCRLPWGLHALPGCPSDLQQGTSLY